MSPPPPPPPPGSEHGPAANTRRLSAFRLNPNDTGPGGPVAAAAALPASAPLLAAIFPAAGHCGKQRPSVPDYNSHQTLRLPYVRPAPRR